MQVRISNAKNKNAKLDKAYVELLKQSNVNIINSKGSRGGYDLTVQIDTLVDFETIQYLIKFDLTVKIGAIVIEDITTKVV